MVADLKDYSCFLFLDFDGVLIRYPDTPGPDPYDEACDEHGLLFQPECVNHLEWLIKESGAGIVLSATWRGRDLRQHYPALPDQDWCDHPFFAREMWAYRNLPGTIVDSTPRVSISLPRKRDAFLAPRGLEIKMWQEQYGVERTPYVIIDDENDMLREQQNRFVQTDTRYGLTREQAQRALTMLRTPILWPWEEDGRTK